MRELRTFMYRHRGWAVVLGGVVLTGAVIWLLFTTIITDPALTLGYVKALAWPLVVLAVILYLRLPLRERMLHLRRFVGWGAEFEFQEAAYRRLEAELAEPVAQLSAPEIRDELQSPIEAAPLDTEGDDIPGSSDAANDHSPASTLGDNAHRREETRESIEQVIRTSAAWGYRMGRAGAPETVPDIVWNEDGSWHIATQVPAQKQVVARAPSAVSDLYSENRHITELESEIKKLERERHSRPISLSMLGGRDDGWLRELKRRLSAIDPTNPWAHL